MVRIFTVCQKKGGMFSRLVLSLFSLSIVSNAPIILSGLFLSPEDTETVVRTREEACKGNLSLDTPSVPQGQYSLLHLDP